jgi:TorA specific chaperone
MSAARAQQNAPAEDGWDAIVVEFLAGVFMARLSTDAVANYREGLGDSIFSVVAEISGCVRGAQRMQSALQTNETAERAARRLSVAFTLLFDGVSGPKTVSLYESAHVSPTGRLFQAPVADMERLLRQADVSMHATVHEPADHISIELALLAHLIRGNTGLDAQIVRHTRTALLDDHLLAWTPGFADRCCENDPTGFYAGAARVLVEFLRARRTTFHSARPIMPTTWVTPCPSV